MKGLDACMQLRVRPEAPVLLEMSTANGRIKLGQGSIVIDVDAKTMRLLSTPSGVFDLQMEYPDGVITTILGGKFVLIPDVAYGCHD